MMFCVACNHDIDKCICPDIDDRIAKLTTDNRLVFKMCQICALHYARCNCENPVWVRSDNGQPLEVLT